MKLIPVLILVIGILALPLILIFGHSLEVSFESSGVLSSYLRYGEGDLSEFSVEEQEHLEEVRSLYFKIIIVFIIAIVLFIGSLIYFRDKNIGIMLFIGGILTLGLLLILYILTKNWDSAFTSFHELFFKTQWQFGEGSLLIKMFPEEIFYNAFNKIITSILFSGIGCIILGLFIRVYRS